MSPTFSVKDLRPYHGEDLRASLFFFSQLWGRINVGASTPTIRNLGLIMKNSNSGGCEALET